MPLCEPGAARKERIAMRVASIRLGSPEDNRIKTMAVVQHVCGVQEQRRIEQPDQHPKPKVVTLMRCCRKQQQVTAVVAKCLSKFEVLCLRHFRSGLIRRQMMRLIEDDQIPAGSFE